MTKPGKTLKIILLTGDVEAGPLSDVLKSHNGDLDIIHAPSLDDLEKNAAVDGENDHLRLISFINGTIVPKGILEIFQGDAYNFHPGPPEYPGSGAAGFAVYEGAKQFGTTAHIMTASVDAGPIIKTVRFDSDPSMRFIDLELRAYRAAFDLFIELSEKLATSPVALLPSGERWTGIKRRKKDVEDMKNISEDMSEDEIKRRFRAFG